MIVIDVNVAVEMAQKTAKGQAFSALMLEGEEVISSEFFMVEIRNVAWKYVHASLMNAQEAERLVSSAETLVDRFIPLKKCVDEALYKGIQYDHPIYDMLYLCLARHHNATLFSLDKKLIALCEATGISCVSEVDF